MKITFVSEKTLSECNPKLVDKLLNTNSFHDVCDVESEFDCRYEEIVDTMFAIVREKRIKNCYLNDKAMTEWLDEYFLDKIYEDLLEEFGEGINKKRFQNIIFFVEVDEWTIPATLRGAKPHDEMARDEARHGKAFKGLLERYFK